MKKKIWIFVTFMALFLLPMFENWVTLLIEWFTQPNMPIFFGLTLSKMFYGIAMGICIAILLFLALKISDLLKKGIVVSSGLLLVIPVFCALCYMIAPLMPDDKGPVMNMCLNYTLRIIPCIPLYFYSLFCLWVVRIYQDRMPDRRKEQTRIDPQEEDCMAAMDELKREGAAHFA